MTTDTHTRTDLVADRYANDHVADVGLPVRLYTTPALHRLIPARAGFLAATLRARLRERTNPAEREAAERMFAALLEHTPRTGEAAGLARAWMAEKSRVAEMFWRPWLMQKGSVEGVENWHAAREDGRGFVLAFGHIAPMFAVPAVLADHGLLFHIVVGPHYFAPKPPGYAGREVLRWRAYGEALGRARMEVASASSVRLSGLLESGEVVGLAFDAPGRTPTPFLGRTVLLGGGAARVAFETRTKVLPVVPRRHGARTTIHIDPPVDAKAFPDVASLQAAVAQRFERFVLEKPEAIQLAWDPLPLIVDAPAPSAQ